MNTQEQTTNNEPAAQKPELPTMRGANDRTRKAGTNQKTQINKTIQRNPNMKTNAKKTTPAPANKMPELPTKSGNTSPLQAGIKNIHSDWPRTYFDIPKWDHALYPDITKGYEYLGEDAGMFRFRITLDIKDPSTGKAIRREGFLFAPGRGSGKAVFIHTHGTDGCSVNAVNIRYKDLPITMRQEIVARLASGPALTMRKHIGIAIVEGFDSLLGIQYLRANNVFESAEKAEFWGLEKELEALLCELKQCEDEEFLNDYWVKKTIADLEKILAMAKAVSLYPAN